MPPQQRMLKLDLPEHEQLREALTGKNGYGVPKLIKGYQLVGNADGRLRDLFDINFHPNVAEGDEDDLQMRNFNFGAMSGEYWDRFLAKWKALIDEDVRWSVINVWMPYPDVMVLVYRTVTGEYLHFVLHRWDHSYDLLMRTDKVVWKTASSRAEKKARKGLLSQLSREQKRQLTLTNSFVEVGKSGVRYLIRASRPTVAYREWKVERGVEATQFLAAMCLHPLGYYRRTYAGCMVPSDEMLAHLLLIRTGEHGFWRRANQHGLVDAAAGL